MCKKNYIVLTILFCFFFLPTLVFATSDDEYEIVSENTKYYKTITYYNNNATLSVNNNSDNSETVEISKEEYDLAESNNVSINGTMTIETTYKRMTSYILTNGSYYRYKNRTVWKSIPSLRGYDIIAVGFLPSVKVHGNPVFLQEYCSGTSCHTSTASYMQTFSMGAGATFKLASGTLSSLSVTFYFDVEKNTTATIIAQDAYSDYAHATSAVLLPTAMDYQVKGNAGIILGSSASSYYDSISVADATWSGSW